MRTTIKNTITFLFRLFLALLKKLNNKKALIIIAVLFVSWTYAYQINSLTSDVVEAKNQIEVLKKNDIRTIRAEIDSLEADAIEYAKMEIDLRKQAEENIALAELRKQYKEESIWKKRCLKKNVDLYLEGSEMEDCSENLERFASYNIKK